MASQHIIAKVEAYARLIGLDSPLGWQTRVPKADIQDDGNLRSSHDCPVSSGLNTVSGDSISAEGFQTVVSASAVIAEPMLPYSLIHLRCAVECRGG